MPVAKSSTPNRVQIVARHGKAYARIYETKTVDGKRVTVTRSYPIVLKPEMGVVVGLTMTFAEARRLGMLTT